jgi:hypothetical protein
MTEMRNDARVQLRRTRTDVEIRRAVRVPRGEASAVKIGQRAELVCWSVMPSWKLTAP